MTEPGRNPSGTAGFEPTSASVKTDSFLTHEVGEAVPPRRRWKKTMILLKNVYEYHGSFVCLGHVLYDVTNVGLLLLKLGELQLYCVIPLFSSDVFYARREEQQRDKFWLKLIPESAKQHSEKNSVRVICIIMFVVSWF